LHPPPHPAHIIVIRRSELTAHLGFFEGDMDQVGRGEDGEGHNHHWPSACPHRDSEREYNEPQIHGVAGKLVGSAENQLVICGRGWAHFGALAPEQENGPNGQNAAYRDKSHPQRHERQTGDVRPAEPPADCRGDKNINESPNGWWHLEHHRRSLGSLQYIRTKRPCPANGPATERA